jgi:signal transduction histidine kinase
MLFLHAIETNGSACADRVPVAEPTAIGLEHALLATDHDARVREIHAALVRDPGVAAWVTAAARMRIGRPPTSLAAAADWFAGRLEAELAANLVPASNSSDCCDIELRLPALVQRLAAYEQQLTYSKSRLEHDKLESLKELAYGASHEINNPLANIAARAQTLLEGERDSERRRKLSAIHRQAMRAHEMISDLMLFARPPKLNLAPCELGQLVRQVVDELREQADEQHTELNWSSANLPLEKPVDATQLAVAVRALVMNSFEALGEGGHVEIVLRHIERDGAPWAQIVVRDDGPGISDQIREHMFDPFFSGREAGRGLGFGLSKCWRIVTDHGGQVIVERPAGGGAEIAILLPLSPNGAGTRPVEQQVSSA